MAYSQRSLMKVPSSAGEEKTIVTRSPRMPTPRMTGLPGAGPASLVQRPSFASLRRREPQSIAFSIDLARLMHPGQRSIERFVGDTEVARKVLQRTR